LQPVTRYIWSGFCLSDYSLPLDYKSNESDWVILDPAMSNPASAPSAASPDAAVRPTIPDQVLKNLKPKVFPDCGTDIAVWVASLEKWFRLAGIQDHDARLDLVEFHLTGEALTSWSNWLQLQRSSRPATRAQLSPEDPARLLAPLTWEEGSNQLIMLNTKAGESDRIKTNLATLRPNSTHFKLVDAVTEYNDQFNSGMNKLGVAHYKLVVLKDQWWRNMFTDLKGLMLPILAPKGETDADAVLDRHDFPYLMSTAIQLAPAAQAGWLAMRKSVSLARSNRAPFTPLGKRERPADTVDTRVHAAFTSAEGPYSPSVLPPRLSGPTSSRFRPSIASMEQPPLTMRDVVRMYCQEKRLCVRCKKPQHGEARCSQKPEWILEDALQEFCRAKGVQVPQRATGRYPNGQGR
jgi:hypothetical protein